MYIPSVRHSVQFSKAKHRGRNKCFLITFIHDSLYMKPGYTNAMRGGCFTPNSRFSLIIPFVRFRRTWCANSHGETRSWRVVVGLRDALGLSTRTKHIIISFDARPSKNRRNFRSPHTTLGLVRRITREPTVATHTHTHVRTGWITSIKYSAMGKLCYNRLYGSV